MQYESQIAKYLLAFAGKPGRIGPERAEETVSSPRSTAAGRYRAALGPARKIRPTARAARSRRLFLHLFRQFFFDLGTFPGEPVEHVWLAPGTTIELIEVSTRRTLTERTQETNQETTTRQEESTEIKDELSEAVKAENGSSTKRYRTATGTCRSAPLA